MNATNYVYSNINSASNYSFRLTYRTLFNTSKSVYTQYTPPQIQTGKESLPPIPNNSSTSFAISIAVPIATFIFLILIVISVTLIYKRK